VCVSVQAVRLVLQHCVCFAFVESLIESALSTGVIEILKDYLVKFRADEDVVLMVLLAVGSLADCGNYCYSVWFL